MEDALISGQERAQDFPRISFTSRGRNYKKIQKAAECVFIIHESVGMLQNSRLSGLLSIFDEVRRSL